MSIEIESSHDGGGREVPMGAPAIYRNIRRWLESIGIRLGKAPEPAPAVEAAAAEPVAVT